MTKDVSTNDLLKVMQDGFAQIARIDSKLDKSFAELAEAINVLSDSTDRQFKQVDTRFDHLEARVTRIEDSMVTRDYLDDKLFGQKFYLRTV